MEPPEGRDYTMSDVATWWQDFQQTLSHPFDTVKAILDSYDVPKEGPPIPIGSVLQISTPSDSIASAAPRSYGVDPETGKLIAPQYFGSAVAAGYDPASPFNFVRDKEAEAVDYYNRQLSNNLADANAGPSSLWIIVIVLVIGFFLIEAVK
jgi:hypothetical protein